MKENKTEFIIIRVTKPKKEKLIQEAGGKKKLSKHIRKLLGIDE